MTCAKTRYESKPKAEMARRTIIHGSNKRETKPVRSYRCPVCKGWHLTSNKSRREGMRAL